MVETVLREVFGGDLWSEGVTTSVDSTEFGLAGRGIVVGEF